MKDAGRGTTPADERRSLADWIKSNPLISLMGALTTVFGLVVSASNGVPLILKAFEIPECLTHADAYRGPASVFRRKGEVWREYPLEGGAPRFEFKQVHRARDVVDLLNLTPRPEIADWHSLMVRLPVCGGVAQIASGVPQRWSDLFQVWRD